MEIIFGVDFGTTNSAIAINDGGRVRVVSVDTDNEGKPLDILRSALFFDRRRKVSVGQEAVRKYVEDCTDGRFMRSIKTLLPMEVFTSTQVWGEAYKVEDLVAIILTNLKHKAEREVGKTINTAVLGRPVMFSTNPGEEQLAEDRLRSAASLAGFNKIVFQFEPIAAALAFESTLGVGEKKTVLIGDFGGGTSDFTVIKLTGGNVSSNRDRRSDILSLSGVYVGGDTFDSMLVWDKIAHYFGRGVNLSIGDGGSLPLPTTITHKLKGWHLLPQLRDRQIRGYLREIRGRVDDPQAIRRLEELIDTNRLFEIFQSMERIKCELSNAESADFLFEELDYTIAFALHRHE
ncbi:MAG: Hsp70 family protein, partial [Candidatus Magasanikbacteria bacterium]|nr:Hsp70 family protein [Candidatus Magasanikbacteria bacterium]